MFDIPTEISELQRLPCRLLATFNALDHLASLCFTHCAVSQELFLVSWDPEHVYDNASVDSLYEMSR
jgi:hypothetical protein